MSASDRPETANPSIDVQPSPLEYAQVIPPGSSLLDSKSTQSGSAERTFANNGFPNGNELLSQFAEDGKESKKNGKTEDRKAGQEPAEDKGKKDTERAVKDLLAKFNEDPFPVRQKAKDKLVEIGADAIPHLLQARHGNISLEERRLIDQSISEIKRKYEPDAAPNSVAEWRKSTNPTAEQDKDSNDNGGRGLMDERVPEILSGKSTEAEGKAKAANLETLAKIERQLGNNKRAESLEQQAKEWLDIKGTRESISKVQLSGQRITDADLEKLKGLPNLKELRLWSTNTTDEGLKKLKDFPALESLELSGRLTDTGFEHIKDLTKLKSLEAHGSIGDKGLEKIKGMTNLDRLEISGPNITADGLLHLKGLTNLTHLNICADKDLGAGLQHLAGLTKLKDVGIYAPLKEDSVEQLKALQSAKHIVLDASNYTAAHMQKLSELKLPNLKTLSLVDPSMDAKAGFDDLMKKLPGVKVSDGVPGF